MSLQPGKYLARPVSAALGYTQNGAEQIGVCFRIDEEGFQNETITWYGTFGTESKNGKTAPVDITLKALRTCGWTGDDLAVFVSDDGALPPGFDRQVLLDLQEDEYDGKVTLKVRWVNDPAGGGVVMKNKMNAQQAATFSRLMKGHAVAAPKAGGVSAHAAQQQRPAPQQRQQSQQRYGTSGHGANAKHTAPKDNGMPDTDWGADGTDEIPFAFDMTLVRSERV